MKIVNRDFAGRLMVLTAPARVHRANAFSMKERLALQYPYLNYHGFTHPQRVVTLGRTAKSTQERWV
jgi:hypothetical protein